jgi:hypothetical protein
VLSVSIYVISSDPHPMPSASLPKLSVHQWERRRVKSLSQLGLDFVFSSNWYGIK